MVGRGLVNRLVALAVAAGAAFVAVVAAGATVFYALSLVLPSLGAAALTAALFLILALGVALVFLRKAGGEEDQFEEEDGGLAARAFTLFRNRPILATTAALAGGWIFLRNPALASLVAAAFTEKSHASRRRR